MILLIEDDKDLRIALEDFISGLHLEVKSASTLEEGLKLIDSFSPAILLTDYLLGGKTSKSIIERCKSQWPKCKSILLTAMPFNRAQEIAKAEGIDYLLPKPFDLYEFENLLLELNSL